MLKLFALAALLIATAAHAAESSRTVNLAAGPSVPDSDDKWELKKVSVIPGGNITRRTGGEVIGLVFMNPDTKKEHKVQIEKVRLIGYSKSGHGKVLVHMAQTKPASPTETLLPLANYSKIDRESHAENHKGLVMLNDGDSAVVSPQALSASRFLVILEAFGDDDASVAIQLTVSGDVDPLGFGTARLVVADAPGNQPEPRHHDDDNSSPSRPSHNDDNQDQGHGGGSDHEKQPSTFCQFHPMSPGCGTYCQFHPMDEHCTGTGSTFCQFHPMSPGCDTYCQFHPMDEHCTNEGSTFCQFHPMSPGCSTFCQFHPMDASCTH